MTFGARFLNDGMSVQMDDTTPCMVLVQKGAWSGSQSVASNAPASSAVLNTKVTITGTNPIMAVNAVNCEVAIIPSKSGSSFTFNVIVYSCSNPWSLTYYIFDKPTTQHSGWGIQIWDANGVCTYQSTAPPMKIVASINGYGTDSISYPTTSVYAMAVYGCAYNEIDTTVDDSYGNITNRYITDYVGGFTMFRNSNNTLGYQFTASHAFGQSGIGTGNPSGSLVIDVTNL